MSIRPATIAKRTHDRNSNRLYRENTTTTEKDELYAYNDLNQLTTLHRGDLDNDKDDGRTARRSPWKNARSDILHYSYADRVKGEVWTLAPVGNWDEYKVDTDGDGADDLDQDRTHNLVNEITDITETTRATRATPLPPTVGTESGGNPDRMKTETPELSMTSPELHNCSAVHVRD